MNLIFQSMLNFFHHCINIYYSFIYFLDHLLLIFVLYFQLSYLFFRDPTFDIFRIKSLSEKKLELKQFYCNSFQKLNKIQTKYKEINCMHTFSREGEVKVCFYLSSLTAQLQKIDQQLKKKKQPAGRHRRKNYVVPFFKNLRLFEKLAVLTVFSSLT